MNNPLPLTKEKVFFAEHLFDANDNPDEEVEFSRKDVQVIKLEDLHDAVVWRNSLVQFSLPEEYDCCDVCHESVKVFYYDEATRGNDGKVFPIMCSVCATNRAFGIENTQSGGKE